jgi:hypothetical protein
MRRTIAATILAATAVLGTVVAVSGTALAGGTSPNTVSCCVPH